MTKKIRFPKDEAAHPKNSEWWYFNGHLKSDDGKEYGFMISFFKMDLIKNRPGFFFLPIKFGYLVHSHLSDIKNKEFIPHYEHFIKMPYEKFIEKNKLYNHYRSTLLKEIKKGIYHLRFNNKPYNVDLVIIAKKPAAMHGKKGIIKIGENSSYYYSFTNMEAKGAIKTYNNIVKVEGTAWMDHQWGNFDLHNKQWDWLSIRLKNNIEIMAYKIIDKATQETSFYTSLINHKGKSMVIKGSELSPVKYWRSKRTGIVYPLYWSLKIPSKKIDLNIKPDFNEQEMSDGIIKYWEGSCSVSGTFDKKKISGKAYMELVGYEKLKSKLF